MAEVAKSVVRDSLSDEDDGCQVEPPEEISLQELIDTELALRVPPPVKSNHCFTSDFLTAEREHSSAGLDIDRPSSPVSTILTTTTTTTTILPSARLDVLSMNEKNLNASNNACNINASNINGDTNIEHIVDSGGPPNLLDVTEQDNNDDWTTVEEVAKEIVGSNGKDLDEEDAQVLIDKKIDDHVGNGDAIIIQDGLHYTTTKTEFTEYIETTNTTVVETITSALSNGASSENLETDSIENSEKKKKKKTTTENGEVTVTRTKKTKKSKKTEEKENHISVKSSFSKFDQLSKKVLHVRSTDPAKASKTFSQGGTDGTGTSTCKACEKTVFAMEQIKAERAVWHKNCFRCHTCNKQLTVDIYSSHEGELYCKPHFKELFKPKVVIEDEEPVRRRKPEMIIRENQPMELPPEVVRASAKPDLGLEELSSLNVKSRFQVFEKQDATDSSLEKSPTAVSVKRSSSILSKVAKFQKKGMDVGVSDDALNGFVCEESESSEEEDDEEEDEDDDKGIVKCRRNKRERPVSFTKIDDVKKNWESQQDMMTRREEMREQRKEELQQIRSRLFMGKQGKMKELYEQAVAESEGKTSKKDVENDIIKSERARVVREKFEKGVAAPSDEDDESEIKTATGNKAVEEDMSVFEEGISKKSRSIFLEMDANAVKTQQTVAPITTAPPPRESMIAKKGRETDSPEREIYRDPDVVRADDKVEDEQTVLKSQTTSRMLSMFRQMEEQKEVIPDGPKPKKCFTPPPDYKGSAGNSEDESEEDDEDEEEDEEEEEEEESVTEDGVVKSSYKVKDEFLVKARNAARAKQLAAKFESWEPDKQSNNNAISMLESEHASIDSTKSLRAKFESLGTETPSKEKARPKVNRFV